MAYSKFHADWKDFPDTTTPITEAALEHIEQGIVDVEAAAAAALAAKRLDQLVAPTGDVSLNSQQLIGLGTPLSPTAAATKAYVDAVAQGLDVKMSVRAATTANITLSGAQTIDGVAVIATNRVLVKNQTTGADNGIYVAAAGAWSRATDADVDAEVTAGMFTFVEAGTVAADQGWVLVTNNPITVGTTALSFSQFSGGGGTVAATAVTVDSTTLVGTGTNAQAVFEELDDGIANHLADTSAAHAASAIAFTPVGTVSATDVQAAIAEVASEGGGGGGSADSDATLTFTDIVTNNSSTTKHGFLPKLNNSRSYYMGGKGEWNRWCGVSGDDWYVDNAALSGGDGRSPAGAFTTFAAALAACQSRDVIYICSDLYEDLTINKEVRVCGVGKRVIFGSGSTLIGARTVNVIAFNVTIENLQIQGTSAFKGVHLALNHGPYNRCSNITIDGTGGAIGANTFYPTSPGTGTKTGIGGIGVMLHNADHTFTENLSVANTSIAVACGTWSTQSTFIHTKSGGNCQDLVMGMYTGAFTVPATTSAAFGYCLATLGSGNDLHCGSNTFIKWQPVSAVGVDLSYTTPPSIDLVGDRTTNYGGNVGGDNTFIEFNAHEGPSGTMVRIGTPHNVFIKCGTAAGNYWTIEGQHNRFIGLVIGSNSVNFLSDYNTWDEIRFEVPNNPSSGSLYGTGNYNTFTGVSLVHNTLVPLVLSGVGNVFKGCSFAAASGAAITRSQFGNNVTIEAATGVSTRTYGTTIPIYANGGERHMITVTDGVGFTISSPLDTTNIYNTDKILVTNPITISIYNGFGTMGTITWGGKYKMAAWTNPANTKYATITFVYNFVNDTWVEQGRALTA